MEKEYHSIIVHLEEIKDIFQSAVNCCGLLISEATDDVEVLRLTMYMDEFQDIFDAADAHVGLNVVDAIGDADTSQVIYCLNYMALHVFGNRFKFKKAKALRLIKALTVDVHDMILRRKDTPVRGITIPQYETIH